MKKALITTILAVTPGFALAQSTLSLDDFDLNPSADSGAEVGAVANSETSEMETCLVDPSQCASTEYRSATDFSLDDVVNLGIVDREEVQAEPASTGSGAALSSSGGTAAASAPSTQPLPTIDIEILFDLGSDDVRVDQENKLRELAGVLRSDRFSNYRFLFMGHTDAKGDDDYNWTLSQRRAESVAQVIRLYTGLPPERVLASGMGETRLKDPNFPLAGINRRVQLVLLPQ